MCRLLENSGLFCKRAILLQGSFSKETCVLMFSTNRCHPIADSRNIFQKEREKAGGAERAGERKRMGEGRE